MKTPVLFIIFNRPDTTQKVFESIRKARPENLFVAADGPRHNKKSENEKCNLTRQITEKIDWPCQVRRLYRDKNLGCKKAVSQAINWFFQNVGEGIILEDDCLPDQSFFRYCSILLEKYRGDSKVMHIGGSSFIDTQQKSSYYFSKYPHVWGWATWKRSWDGYDSDLNNVYNSSIFGNYKFSFFEKIFWLETFHAVKNGHIDTWDYQWVYKIWKNKGIAITPTTNLIKNIGFIKDSTHTKTTPEFIRKQKTGEIKQIIHCNSIKINDLEDKKTFSTIILDGIYTLPIRILYLRLLPFLNRLK